MLQAVVRGAAVRQTPAAMAATDDSDRPGALARLVEHPAFTGAIIAVIVANAVVLGMQTYDGVQREHGDLLGLLNSIFLGVFVVELMLRLASYGTRPQRFFTSGWNVFDFVVVSAAFVPGIRESSTVLRIARLLRVVRIIRLLPDVRVLIVAVTRSLPPLASMTVLTALIVFLYGMVGWLIFGESNPEEWGNIGRAMLTLFVLLTLENFPAALERGLEIEPWSIFYFGTFVMIAAFIVLNVLIGVVLQSMEEAREIERERERHEAEQADVPHAADLVARIEAARAALADLEHALAEQASSSDGGSAAEDRPAGATSPT